MDYIKYLYEVFEIDDNLEFLKNFIIYNIHDDLDIEINNINLSIYHTIKGKKQGLFINYYSSIIDNIDPLLISFPINLNKTDLNYLKKFSTDYLDRSTNSFIKFGIKLPNIKNETYIRLKEYLEMMKPTLNKQDSNIIINEKEIIINKSIDLSDYKTKVDKKQIPKNIITEFEEFVKSYSIPPVGQVKLIDMLKNKELSDEN